MHYQYISLTAEKQKRQNATSTDRQQSDQLTRLYHEPTDKTQMPYKINCTAVFTMSLYLKCTCVTFSYFNQLCSDHNDFW